MNRTVLQGLATVLLAGAAYADVANMSGDWVLNTKRSEFGKKQPPMNVTMHIEHAEPKFKYSGSTTPNQEAHPTQFKFDGAIDGKEYVVDESTSQRKLKFVRKSDNTIESISHVASAKAEERSTITLSRDGKTLVRKMEIKLADGKKEEWTEIYERR